MNSKLVFDVLCEDKVIASIKIKNNEVNVKSYPVIYKALHPFGACTSDSNVSIEYINDFFESRCFDRSRPDKDELLKELGLSDYEPIEIIKRTHGSMCHDFIWIRFEGEDLTWKDISNGRL